MDSTTVSTPDAIVNVSEGNIERIIFILPSGHGDGGLVAPKNKGNKHCPMRRGILGDYVL